MSLKGEFKNRTVEFSVYDLTGRKCLTTTADWNGSVVSVAVKRLKSGVYIGVLKTGDETVRIKIPVH